MVKADADMLLGDETPLGAYHEVYMRYLLAEKRASDYTLRNYGHALEMFAIFLQDHLDSTVTRRQLEQLTVGDFRSFLAWRRGQGVGSATARLTLSAIRSFFGFLRRRYDLHNDGIALVRGPRGKERLPRPIAEPDAKALIGALGDKELAPWVAARNVALFTLLYGAGLRISEALALTADQVPLGESLRIKGKGGKTRLVPLLPCIDETISAYKELCPYWEPEGALFYSVQGKAMSARMAQKVLAQYRPLLGLPDTATPHALRHSFATQLLAGGGDLRAVQELLGHSSIAATQRYTKIEDAQMRALYLKAHPRA